MKRLNLSDVIVPAVFGLLLLCATGCGEKERTIDELLALGQESYDKGDYFEARSYFGEALKKETNNRDALYHLGQTYFAENMFDSSYATLSRAEKLYPGSREINSILHEVSAKTGHYQEAINALLALSRAGDSIEQYYRQIAEYAFTDSIGHTAYYYYQKLIEMEPDSLNYYLRCAESAIIMSEVSNGIEILKLALKKFGDKPLILTYLARYYSYVQAYSESEQILRRLLEQDSSVVIQLQLATALTFQGDKVKMREAYDIFSKLRTKTAQLNKIDSMISYLEAELGIK